jgi:hypothetical protein
MLFGMESLPFVCRRPLYAGDSILVPEKMGFPDKPGNDGVRIVLSGKTVL